MKCKREIIIILIGFTLGFLITKTIKFLNNNKNNKEIIIKYK